MSTEKYEPCESAVPQSAIQSNADVAPTVGVLYPSLHGVHASLMGLLAYVWRGHRLHDELPFFENWPGGHSQHDAFVRAPTKFEAVPAAQGEHAPGSP